MPLGITASQWPHSCAQARDTATIQGRRRLARSAASSHGVGGLCSVSTIGVGRSSLSAIGR